MENSFRSETIRTSALIAALAALALVSLATDGQGDRPAPGSPAEASSTNAKHPLWAVFND